MLYLLVNLFWYIPIIGKYLNTIAIAYSYGYSILYYSLQNNNYSSKKSLMILESNLAYTFGIGIFYSLILEYIPYVYFFIIFVSFFPLCILNIRFNVYPLQYKKKYTSYIFHLPSILTNSILSMLDSFLTSYYNINIKTYAE